MKVGLEFFVQRVYWSKNGHLLFSLSFVYLASAPILLFTLILVFFAVRPTNTMDYHSAVQVSLLKDDSLIESLSSFNQ